MAAFWKIALLLVSVLYPTMGHMLVHTEDNLADCLHASIGGLTSSTLRISIEVENVTIRRNFEDTLDRFLAKNDAILVDLASTESCGPFIGLYFVDSLKSFKTLVDRQHSRECNTSSGKQLFFVVLPSSASIGTLEEILNLCWEAYILNVNVLIEDGNKVVNLYTYFPFTKTNCRDSTPTIHNRFVNGTFKFNRELFPQKLDNLWQCPIKAIVFEEAPFIWIDHNQVHGINGDIFKTLAEMMNFSIEMVISPDGRGIFYPNSSVSGSFKLLKDGLADITLGASGCVKYRRGHFASTDYYSTRNVYAIVRRPKLYRSLDIIYLPFDLLTWICLFAILFAKWICQLLWRKYTNRCVASRYCSTRLHTMTWLYAMFIIRSSYEGSIFRFLQNRPISRIPQTIDEAIELGYKFVANYPDFVYLQGCPQLVDHIVLNNAHLADIFASLSANEERYAVVKAETEFTTYNNDPSMHEKYALIPEPVSIINYCLEMQKNSFLTEAINTRIQRLITNGYIDRNMMKYIQMDKFLNKGEPDERASISLQHIKGAFILLAMCTVGSVFVFIAELLAVRRPWLKRLLEVFY